MAMGCLMMAWQQQLKRACEQIDRSHELADADLRIWWLGLLSYERHHGKMLAGMQRHARRSVDLICLDSNHALLNRLANVLRTLKTSACKIK